MSKTEIFVTRSVEKDSNKMNEARTIWEFLKSVVLSTQIGTGNSGMGSLGRLNHYKDFCVYSGLMFTSFVDPILFDSGLFSIEEGKRKKHSFCPMIDIRIRIHFTRQDQKNFRERSLKDESLFFSPVWGNRRTSLFLGVNRRRQDRNHKNETWPYRVLFT